ncbi:MAG TPA: glycosyltransferase family 2 protein [Bacteroidales bacterium]|jgi:cellulose synthase/poly-beta-1,6-N-acetylglucosamine synthase-like glycosyltransferase|nr:glycosyltransferase family 2 protein [Bacteroidales bacterium]HOX74541.1 glycosyltransferase family 2 protein [Bacteroidales bacterium]HPM86365.1 glycosyltransferase family 2 protein [Bacteroidales bacterium]HQM68560.1 glycosyltransferase family 2 protein [Bacteroidales bacterium]
MGFIFGHIIFIITLIIFGSYLLLGIFSAIALRKYLRKNSYVNYNSLVLSPLSPRISIIAPAFNESKTIIDNVRTLLSLYYNNFEVILVNDGSTDNTFEKVEEAFELEKVNYYFDYRIPCERIKGVYKSKNPSFTRLTVIDKNNGGKADSLNAGINICKSNLIVSIDADSIIEADSILKLVKPFLEEKDHKVIGTGGVIRIVNSCDVELGHIRNIHVPKQILPRLQVLDYTRAFLLGRMAWSQLDGLMLISGAMGIFDRETVIKAGGYSTKTVGEDMELVLRMRRYMSEHNAKYEVTYIPDPLCWTEVPSDLKSLRKQRTRWTRGLVESLKTHRKLFFNPKFNKLGLLGYPYWFFFEWLAPLIAFGGFIYTIILILTSGINWPFYLLLFVFVYSFAVLLTTWAILFEEITFHKYKRKRDVFKLIATAFVEPFFYPVHTYFAVKGNIEAMRGKTGWGKAERSGFDRKKKKIHQPTVRQSANISKATNPQEIC